MGRMNYVIDTNVAIDYVDIIPNGAHITLDHPNIDLTGSNLIIPTAVIRELNSFKTEQSDRGHSTREALRRIRKITEHANLTMGDVYDLEAPISVATSDYTVSILPVHQHFCQALPFHPSDRDMDGQIILTAMAALYRANGLAVDGTKVDLSKLDRSKVVLLTNDNGMAIRANSRGIITARFGYTPPQPYTGRRDVVVPDDLFAKFYDGTAITGEEWRQALPSEPRLIANEFLIMKPESGNYPEGFDRQQFYHIGRYNKVDDEIVQLSYWRSFWVEPKNEGQAIYAEALMDYSISCVICTGPAGSGKTFMSSIFGLESCRKHSYIGVTVVPCDVENDKLGALPGDLDEKMDPSVQPIKNALKNYLLQTKNYRNTGDKMSIKKRIMEEVEQLWDWFENIPIYHARGRDFTREIAIYDEFQDQNRSQADTLLKRIGDHGKMIITGDIEQIHSTYLDHDNNGIVYAREIVKDDPMVAQVTFTEEEVVRHPLVKLIAQRQREARRDNT